VATDDAAPGKTVQMLQDAGERGARVFGELAERRLDG